MRKPAPPRCASRCPILICCSRRTCTRRSRSRRPSRAQRCSRCRILRCSIPARDKPFLSTAAKGASSHARQVIEDQVTYPLTTALLAVPRSKVVRGFSFFGVSFVYVVFEDGTDLYWARSRVLEYLNFAAKRLPEGITPSLGPDATGVGWVYQYVVLGAQRTLAELRTIQDWYLRYQLTKAEGVAEVASVGGFVQQYQVVVDPRKLQAYGIPLSRVSEAIRASNQDVGGRSVELSETEYVVRGRGYIRNTQDIEQIMLKMQGGTPVLLRDVARIELGPEERSGVAELNGTGEVVTGTS